MANKAFGESFDKRCDPYENKGGVYIVNKNDGVGINEYGDHFVSECGGYAVNEGFVINECSRHIVSEQEIFKPRRLKETDGEKENEDLDNSKPRSRKRKRREFGRWQRKLEDKRRGSDSTSSEDEDIDGDGGGECAAFREEVES